ncbi:MAG: hypothetical protein V4587_02205 [Acidobacteriota bacterium]
MTGARRMAQASWLLSAVLVAGAQSAVGGGPRVTLAMSGSPLAAINAIGRQARLPIGIVVGKDYGRLCRLSGSFDFQGSDARDALRKVAERAGYTLTEHRGVEVLLASDIAPWQRDVLNYKLTAYPGMKNETMAYMGVMLTEWMQAAFDAHGFAGSVLGSLTDRPLSLPAMRSVSIQEIADRVVSLDEGGMWIMKPTVAKPEGAKDVEIEVISYHDRPDASSQISCGPTVDQSTQANGGFPPQ